MAKFLKRFQTTAQYNAYAASADFITPNVSLCDDAPTVVHYNPHIATETRVVAKYNVTSASYETPLRTNYEQNIFKSMEIDGVQLENLVTEYTFSTTGIHTVKYELYDETKLGNNAPVFNNGYLIEAFIPDSVTTIGTNAFLSCTSLNSVNIPNGVTSIGAQAFATCGQLSSITIPSDTISIGSQAFDGCYMAASNFINNSSLDEVENDYWDCNIVDSDIDGLLIKDNVAIKYRGSSSALTIPSSVTSIGEYAFIGCSGLRSIDIPSGVTSIGESAFKRCSGLTSVTIGNSVTSIGNSAFQSCIGLTSINIPNSVTSIGASAFTDCSGMTSVAIGNGVTSIGNYAFYGCYSITSIVIPDNVTSIGEFAFLYCVSATSVTIGSGVTSIGNSAFRGANIVNITVDSNNTTYDSRNNCNAIIETSTNTLIQACKTSTIPNTITSIGNTAFYACPITSITIPNSVTSIGTSSFQWCSHLETITSYAMSAPSLGVSTFFSVKEGGTLYVPVGSTGYNVWMGTDNGRLGKYNWTKVEQ